MFAVVPSSAHLYNTTLCVYTIQYTIVPTQVDKKCALNELI